jgi:hypothetical protein
VIDNKSGVIKSDNNITIHAKTLNNTAYHYDTKQDDSDGYYGYDVNEKVVKSDYVMDQTLVSPWVFSWVFSWVLVVSCVSFCVSLINPSWFFLRSGKGAQ